MPDQPREALRKANKIRAIRSDLKIGLTAGELELAEIIVIPVMAKAKVYDVLRALPRIGCGKATHMLNRSGIGGTATCGQLTDRQSEALIKLWGKMSQERERDRVRKLRAMSAA